MAKGETIIANEIMLDSSRHGCTLWRNVKGLFSSPDGKRKILAGLLAPGSSDLIGFRRVKITPEMVGQTIAQFVAIEVKKDGGYPSHAQRDFCEFIGESGGLAGVARSPDDSRRICKIKLDEPQRLR